MKTGNRIFAIHMDGITASYTCLKLGGSAGHQHGQKPTTGQSEMEKSLQQQSIHDEVWENFAEIPGLVKHLAWLVPRTERYRHAVRGRNMARSGTR